jgi:hypothetical protein
MPEEVIKLDVLEIQKQKFKEVKSEEINHNYCNRGFDINVSASKFVFSIWNKRRN